MAYPVILFNSSGSDTEASGAGPSTAEYGTDAEWSGTTFTLGDMSGGPDLSGVATDGSHAIWVDTSTGRKFFAIFAKDESGFTVTTEATIAGDTSGLDWAIGGKRETLAGSSELYDNDGAAGDLGPGWVVELASGFTETFTSSINIRCSGQASNFIIIRGESGSATKPVLTVTTDIALFLVYNLGKIHIRDIDVDRTGNTDGDAALVGNSGGNVNDLIFENIKTTGASLSNRWVAVINAAGAYRTTILNCDFSFTTGLIIDATRGVIVKGCKLRSAGSYFISAADSNSRVEITENEMYGSGGFGISVTNYQGNMVIARNTIVDSGTTGIRLVSGSNLIGIEVYANLIVGSGQYGISASASTYLSIGSGNHIYDSTSGVSNNILNFTAASTADPDFVDAAGGDVTPQTDLSGVAVADKFKPSASYLYPGCIQPECAGGDGTPQLINGGLVS